MNDSFPTVQITLDGDVVDHHRPYQPFKKIPIRLFGTNKTTDVDQSRKPYGRRTVKTGNCLDPVRGCSGGRTNHGLGCWWGCYAKEMSLRFHRLFDIPVSMILNETLLSKDLRRLSTDWVRIGVNGDPCFDWELTSKVVDLVARHDKIPVVVTRFWEFPDGDVLALLAEAKAHLHVSLCAFDPPVFREKRLRVMYRYHELGGTARLRLVSFAFKPDDPLWAVQNELAQHVGVIEQPARVMRSNPVWSRLDSDRYAPHSSYVTGTADHRRLTAGSLYPLLLQCVTGCADCHHQCGTRVPVDLE